VGKGLSFASFDKIDSDSTVDKSSTSASLSRLHTHRMASTISRFAFRSGSVHDHVK
jgi:hypothetical protein